MSQFAWANRELSMDLLSQMCIEERGPLTTTKWSNGRYPNSGRSRPSLIVVVLGGSGGRPRGQLPGLCTLSELKAPHLFHLALVRRHSLNKLSPYSILAAVFSDSSA